MSAKVVYFEDLLIDYLRGVLDKTSKVSPDAFDSMWFDLFQKTKEFAHKADESYTQDEEKFRQDVVALAGIYNDGTLMFPDLVAKALHFVESTKEEQILKAQQLERESQPVMESTEEKLVSISDLEYEDGYLHFHVYADGYALEGLYRLYDPENGPDMTLVSIDYGYLHPIIERQWSRIEESLYESSLSRYHAILDKSEAFKEKVIKAMEAAGYTYDVLESYDGWHRFLGEGGVSIGFDALREAAEWLEGVVFDDPDVARNVEEALHPELCEAQGRVADVLADAARRASDAPISRDEDFVKG